MSPPGFLKSQLLTTLPYPTRKFSNQTIIVTGSNIGLGLEAARYFVRLDAAKVILAVRTLSKGEAAKASIEASEKRVGVVEVWELDLESYASVKAFAVKANLLERLDVAVMNAGIMTPNFTLVEDNERTITVNVISSFLLALLLIPKLRKTAVRFAKTPVLSFTGSFTHHDAAFPEKKTEHIFQELAKQDSTRMPDRYRTSKLIGLLCFRELATKLTESGKEGRIIASTVNPGFVATNIMNEARIPLAVFSFLLRITMSRTAEVGARTLVLAAEGDEETHGQYLNDCKVGKVSDFVLSEDGARVQKKLWEELSGVLEKIEPGIMQHV